MAKVMEAWADLDEVVEVEWQMANFVRWSE
jgi:hypothetical protein